jgi:hypothetical protein
VLYTLPISYTSYEATHYAFFFNILSHHPSSFPRFSSARCSQTPSVYFLPLISDTKFHTHTKQQARTQKVLGSMVTDNR